MVLIEPLSSNDMDRLFAEDRRRMMSLIALTFGVPRRLLCAGSYRPNRVRIWRSRRICRVR